MTEQIIYSRWEYPIGDQTFDEIFEEYRNCFKKVFDEREVLVGGADVGIDVNARRAIVLSFDRESDAFLRLKFCGRKDVMFQDYNKGRK